MHIVRVCFASPLGDCDGPLSREHFFSKCVQEHLRGRGEYRLYGAPWQKPGEWLSSIENTQARILCARHNNALSDIDGAALAVFAFLDEWRSKIQAGSHVGESSVTIAGAVLERWMLKMLVGVLVSGNAALRQERVRDYTPSRRTLDVLFGITPLSRPFGLYMTAVPGARSLERRDFRFAALFNADKPCGARCVIYGIPFVLLLEPYGSDPDGLLTHSNYRPCGVRIARRAHEQPCAAELRFQWKRGGSSTGLQLWCEVNSERDADQQVQGTPTSGPNDSHLLWQ
jgi:hypothetical protein